MKRVHVKTETTDTTSNGTTTTKTERLEESTESGLLEAGGFLILLLFTLLLTFLTYKFVSNINQQEQNHGIQIKQEIK